MHNAIYIADYFIGLSQEGKKGRGLSFIKTLKLPYIAHGYTLACLDKPLIHDRVEVKKYGPYYAGIHRAYWREPSPKTLPEYIKTSIMHLFQIDEGLTVDEESILKDVYKLYSKESDRYIITACSMEKTPWFRARDEGKLYIPNDYIKEYYLSLIKKAGKS